MSQNIQVSFTVETKLTKSTLRDLARLTGKFSKSTEIMIRVLNRAIELSINVVIKRIDAITHGEADIKLPVVLLKGYLTDGAHKTFGFRSGELLCGTSIYSHYNIRVSPVFSDTKTALPVNLNRVEILHYWLNKSPSEIEKAGLTDAIEVAKRNLQTNIQEALVFLKDYNVNYDELEILINNKILD